MSKRQPRSNADSKAPDVSKVIKLPTNHVAVERAFQLIDSYIIEKWHEIPRLPVSHDGDAA